jgi:hypothetical protein
MSSLTGRDSELSQEQLEALQGASPSADDILKNLDSLNEEISDIPSRVLPEDSLPNPVRTKPRSRKKSKKKGASSAPAAPPLSRAKRKIQEAAEKQKLKGEPMSLDSELEALDSEIDNQINDPEQPQNLNMQEQILKLLRETPDAPDDTQIAVWKHQLGKNAVHVMALGEGDVYVFTHLKRGQWKKIQEMMAKIQQSGSPDMEDQLKEKVISHCVLWPKPLSVEFFYNSRAGVVDSLYQVILLNSYFLSPQQAMLLTTQL